MVARGPFRGYGPLDDLGLGNVIARLSQDIETHRACDNWMWDGRLSLSSMWKLREIVRARAKDFSKITSSSIVLKIPAWDSFLKERSIKRIDHPCERQKGEISVRDPFGSLLVMTEETARKILVLGGI